MADFRISKPTLDDTAATDTTSAWSLNALLRLIANRLGGTGSVRITDGTDEALVTSGKGLHVNLRNDAGTEVGTTTTPVKVDVQSALPAGSAAIGKLAANSGVDIGDVDVTSLPKAATSALANISGSATSVTLQASNANRLGLCLHNDSTAILYLKLGATASATSYSYKIEPNAHWELPFLYSGIVDGIWSSATGTARMTELTA